MDLCQPTKGAQPRGVLVRRPILLSRAWLVFLLWTFATAVKISLPPLPAWKGHVPEINAESPRHLLGSGSLLGQKALGCWVCTTRPGDPLSPPPPPTPPGAGHGALDSSELNRSQFPRAQWLIPCKCAPSPGPSIPGKSKFVQPALEASSLLDRSYSWSCTWFLSKQVLE